MFARRSSADFQLVTLIAREGKVKILGEAAYVGEGKKMFLSQLKDYRKRGNTISEQNVDYALSLAFEGNEDGLLEVDRDIICHTLQGILYQAKDIRTEEICGCHSETNHHVWTWSCRNR